MKTAYLGLGSNVGDRLEQLESAIKILDNADGVQVSQISPVYETEPVGYVEQPYFLNLCIEVKTILTPQKLLQQCFYTEHQLHRVRDVRWGPRTLDVDILLYENEIIEEETLTVPHPRMRERAFVLTPLNDIAANVVEPHTQLSIADLVIPDDTVKKYKE